MKKGIIEKLKIMTVLGTRPEIIRLSRIIPLLDKYTNHILVHTTQSFDYELSEIFFKELELREPDYSLKAKAETLGGQIGNIIKQTEEVMIKEKPDALFVLGDTNSSLTAIIAKRMGIPIFHMEGGNRSFDFSVDEETNRAIVDAIADYSLPYSENSRRYLINQGVHPSTVFITGSPLTEVYAYYGNKIDNSNILSVLGLKPQKYFTVSVHRGENVDNPKRLEELFESLNFIAKYYELPLIVTFHPHTKKRMGSIKHIDPLVQFYKPFGIFDYIKLEKNALCALSDSGTIQEESSVLNFPAVQIRVNMERQESFDAGSIILGGLNKNTIVNAVELVIDRYKKGERVVVPDYYKDLNVSTKVLKLIMGLTGIRKYRI